MGQQTTETEMVKPILKWAGGKSQILDKITACFPSKDDFSAYHEPFFGGGAVFFAVKPENGTINDLNPRLYNFYNQIKENPEELIELNRLHQQELNEVLEATGTNGFSIDKNGDLDQEAIKDFYYEKRERFNSLRSHELLEASLLLLLNRLCYNGLYRENTSGEFNVPIGDFTEPDVVREERILEASEVLEGIEIRCEEYSYVEGVARDNDVVYFDPPYKPVSETADFSKYTADGFTDEDQQDLADLAKRLDEKGLFVVVSNSPPVNKYYDSEVFTVTEIRANRVISRDGSNRTGAEEVIITNIPQEIQGKLSFYATE